MKVEIPVAVGELFDKISILNIKKNKVTDVLRVTTILHELSQLHAIATSIDPNYYKGKPYARLYAVNETLYRIEDDIRVLEGKKEFGAAFIALARRVYTQNDKRAHIKGQINLIYNSDIEEVKTYAKY